MYKIYKYHKSMIHNQLFTSKKKNIEFLYFTSKASLRTFPKTLNAKTNNIMAIPGNKAK